MKKMISALCLAVLLTGCSARVDIGDTPKQTQTAAAQQAQLAQAQAQASAAKDIGSIPLDEEHAGSAIAEAMAQNDGMGGMA